MGVRIPASFEDATGTIARLTGEIEFLVAATPGEVLTANNPASTASFAAGGGGSGGVQVVTVPVSSAQILDLFNTPVVLVPGVAGKVIVQTGYNIAYVAGATPYTDNGGGIVASVGGSSVVQLVQGAGFWDQAASQLYALGYGSINPEGASSLFDGADLVMSEDTANPTLGDGTLKVTLSYFLAPTA